PAIGHVHGILRANPRHPTTTGSGGGRALTSIPSRRAYFMGQNFSRSLAVLALAASVALFPIGLAAQANPADSNANRIAQENQQHEPHMAAALEHLRQAEQELQQAAANKGGHREQAINLTHQAMSEVEQGIQYYNQHVSHLSQGGGQPYNGMNGSAASTGLVR